MAIGIRDKPRRNKTLMLRIERTSMLRRERKNNGQGKRTHFIKREKIAMAREK